ncbi:hypothetical protein F4778DRAFT_712124 [Xylariomycetidae sp. FL2044]|nr:hypothetical protein F4778DRAFT_712124 [Xylariomycetidae sp. FL2044]
MSQATTASDSDSSDSSDTIDLSSHPTTVAWDENTLHDMSFHMYSNPSTNTAFFKLRALIGLKANTRKTPVLLFIDPSTINTLSLIPQGTGRPDHVCLRFALGRLATLVIPRGDVFVRNKESGYTLDSMKTLAYSTVFDVSFTLARRIVSETQLQSLCSAVSTGQMAVAGHLANMAGLYGGKGGIPYRREGQEPRDLAPPPTGPPPTSAPGPSELPSYDELHHPGRLQASDPTSFSLGSINEKKRRRDDEDDVTMDQPSAREMMESFCRKAMSEMKASLRTELRAELQIDLQEELQKLEARVMERVEQKSQDLEGEIEELRREVADLDDVIDARIEDGGLDVRCQLEDLVKEEMRAAGDKIVNRIEGIRLRRLI